MFNLTLLNFIKKAEAIELQVYNLETCKSRSNLVYENCSVKQKKNFFLKKHNYLSFTTF